MPAVVGTVLRGGDVSEKVAAVWWPRLLRTATCVHPGFCCCLVGRLDVGGGVSAPDASRVLCSSCFGMAVRPALGLGWIRHVLLIFTLTFSSCKE